MSNFNDVFIRSYAIIANLWLYSNMLQILMLQKGGFIKKNDYELVNSILLKFPITTIRVYKEHRIKIYWVLCSNTYSNSANLL